MRMMISIAIDLLAPICAVYFLFWLIRTGSRAWMAYWLASSSYLILASIISAVQGYSLSIYVIVLGAYFAEVLLWPARIPDLSLSAQFGLTYLTWVLVPTAVLWGGSFVLARTWRARHNAKAS